MPDSELSACSSFVLLTATQDCVSGGTGDPRRMRPTDCSHRADTAALDGQHSHFSATS